MEYNNTPAKEAAEKRAPYAYTKPMTLLMLFAVALGVLFERGVLYSIFRESIFYPLFFLLCAVAAVVLCRERFRKSREAKALLAVLTALCLLHALHPNASEDVLGLYDLAAIPGISMLLALFSARDYPIKREGAILTDFFSAWTAGAFKNIPRFFGAAAALVRGSKRGAVRNVLIGLAVAVPVVAAVLMLLSSADAAMQRLVSNILGGLDLGDLLWRGALTVLTAMLVYSAIHSLAFDEQKALAPYREGALPGATFTIAIAAVLVIYAVYAYFEFTYLFGGRLPAEYTYAAYARQGFFELIAVSIINLTLFGLALRYAKKSRGAYALYAALIAATVLLLVSAATRLILYIGAYGLTFNRILPLAFMGYLLFVLILCAVRLAKEKTPLLRIAAWGLIVWYLLLYLPDWQAIISQYNAL